MNKFIQANWVGYVILIALFVLLAYTIRMIVMTTKIYLDFLKEEKIVNEDIRQSRNMRNTSHQKIDD